MEYFIEERKQIEYCKPSYSFNPRSPSLFSTSLFVLYDSRTSRGPLLTQKEILWIWAS